MDYFGTSNLIYSTSCLHLVNSNKSGKAGVAYNAFDFGNFLWGRTGAKLGFSLGTLQFSAHLNNAFNGRDDNPSLKVNVMDTRADQQAIVNGYFYPKESIILPRVTVKEVVDQYSNPGTTQWFKPKF